jgi:uncharacterized protein YgbK (DUF1537 family)
MSREEARRTAEEAAESVLSEARQAGFRVLFVCRSDSTLRGHFPTEIDAVARVLRRFSPGASPARIFAPQFFEAGRLTTGDTQYMYDGPRLIPTSESEFARDSRFAYSTSRLPDYIEEKSAGKIRSEAVASISAEFLEAAAEEEIEQALPSGDGTSYTVVNAERYGQLDRFAAALRRAAAAGREFLIQSSSSLPRSLSGIGRQPPLDAGISRHSGPGLVIAGSHVQKTTRQLHELLKEPAVEGLEIDVSRLLEDPEREDRHIRSRIETTAGRGASPALFTSREELRFADEQESIRAGTRIAHFLSRTVRTLPFSPSFLIAKGGITSYEILVRGLEISRARVLGQILPGVPVIAAPETSLFPGMPYVIFPGNVGKDEALREAFRRLSTSFLS